MYLVFAIRIRSTDQGHFAFVGNHFGWSAYFLN